MFVNTLKYLKSIHKQTCESPVKSTVIGVLTLETDYKSKKGYPLDNSRHTDNTSQFENGTVLILDEKSP